MPYSKMSQSVPADECKVLLSKKFGPKLIHRGYIYTVHKQRPNCVRWRCTQRNILCRGSMTTNAVHYQTSAKLLMPHNHVPDRQAVAATVAKSLQGFVDASDAESEQTSAINRLQNLGTAVKVKTKEEPAAANDDVDEDFDEDDDDHLFGQQVDNDTNWKPSAHHLTTLEKDKGGKDKPVTPTATTKKASPSPVKVSKRIMEKKQMRTSRKIELSSTLKSKTPRLSTSSSRGSEPPVVAPSAGTGGDYAVSGGGDETTDEEEVCLRWNSHYNNMQAAFPTLLAREQYVDVTLCSEGQSIRCHKLVLSACSPYFEELIAGMSPWQHPVIYMKGTPFWVLKALVDFMYVGEVGIEQSRLAQVLDVGAELKIKGLAMPSSQPTPPAFSYLQIPAKDATRPSANSTPKAPAGPPVLRPVAPSTPAKVAATPPPPLISLLKVKSERKSLDDNVNSTPQVNTNTKQTKQQQSKKAQKRRASDVAPPPLPEHLLFMRKGTRSRPLVKTPKIYDPESYTKSRSSLNSRASLDSKDHRSAPVHTSTPSNSSSAAVTPVKQQPEETTTTPMEMEEFNANESDMLSEVQIKQEPIDITETDVTYGNFVNEGHVLRFDEDEPGESGDDDKADPDPDLDDGDAQEEDGEQEFMEVIAPPTIDKDALCEPGDDAANCTQPAEASSAVFD